jgi:iron complex outermembrane recepter protein
MRHYHRTRSHRRPAEVRRALACALRASLGTSAAMAQQAAAPSAAPEAPQAAAATTTDGSDTTTTLDEVRVIGIRGSIQSSIDDKRDETVVSDVLSAEDIGDLPALSIGEAIETITGASTHREKGGASEISIRGLGPFLGSASFNGREATNGSGDRSVNFNQFPSELINKVAIFKTQRADFIEGGIAGTINMETVKPLDFGKRRVQLEGRATYSEDDSKLRDGDGIGWRGTASYLDQFDMGGAGQLGISLGLQSLEGNNPEEVLASSSTWTACDDTRTVTNGNCPELSNQAINQNGTPFYLIPNSRIYRQIVEHDERDAAFVALQWRPNEAWDVSLDYQNSQRTFTEDRSELNFADGRRAIANRVVNDEGALLGYTGSSALESTSNYKVRDEEYEGGGLAVQWRPNEAWQLSTDLSYSHTLRTETDLNVRLRSDDTDIYGNRVPGITGARYVDYRYDYIGDVPGIVVNPLFDVNRHDNFSDVARARRDELVREHRIRAARFDGAYFPESGLLTAVKAGARLSEATYTDLDDRVELNVSDRARIREANLACRNEFPQDDFLDSASGNTIDSWATFDSRCLFRAVTGVDDTGRNTDTRSSANNDVEEKTKALYLMGEFSSELFGLPVTGNVGVRWIKTDVESLGLRGDLDVVQNPDGTIQLVETGDFTSQTIKASNDVFLPSLNANFGLNDQTQLRFGLYRAMARPDLSALGAGRTFVIESGTSFGSVEEAIRSVSATGNPRATPLLSWNADVSLEWYPNPDSMLAAAVYYKQFNGGSIPTVIDESFVIDGVTVVIPVAQDTTTDKKSDLFGLELTAMHRFSYLPAPFDGLGFKASYNYADSNFENHDLRLGDQVDPQTGEITPGIVAPANIFGLSRHVFSGSLYYTIGPVELQGIYKYRSEYYQKFVGGPSQNRYIHGNATVDFRATWRASRNLSFSLEASNLTDEPKISDMPISGSFHEYHAYGRRYYFGVRYRF